MNNQHVLVTGGLGYIGSHTCVQMIQQGMQPVILDNLHNANLEVLNRIEAITGVKPVFYQGDVRDGQILESIFANHQIHSVIHFAGLKAVGESVQKPIEYYDVNVNGTLVLVESMKKAGVTTNPYGTSKYMVERILSDLYTAEDDWSLTLLRYFNPVGAHPSGTMGEDPQGVPNNLAPFVSQVAVGRRPQVMVFGNDYPTPDGTGVRDYIHVMDLADGHIAALNKVSQQAGLHVYNLGTGTGTSVLEIITAFEKAAGKPIKYEIVARRPGDIAECWSSPEKALKDLSWKAQYSIQDMVNDSWRWQFRNPNGYK
ncbi:SDR family NAD(P)-dependent oxidoreductase [Providencia rettgeri]|nr:SDR family NAD(P)-dependent oxidoreductase [Providencia rettgeri]